MLAKRLSHCCVFPVSSIVVEQWRLFTTDKILLTAVQPLDLLPAYPLASRPNYTLNPDFQNRFYHLYKTFTQKLVTLVLIILLFTKDQVCWQVNFSIDKEGH